MKWHKDVYHFHMVAPKMHLLVVLVVIMPLLDSYKHEEDTNSSLHALKVEVQVHSK